MKTRVEFEISPKLAFACMIEVRRKGQNINRANFLDAVKDELFAFGEYWEKHPDSLGPTLLKANLYEYELAWQDLKRVGFNPPYDPYIIHRNFGGKKFGGSDARSE